MMVDSFCFKISKKYQLMIILLPLCIQILEFDLMFLIHLAVLLIMSAIYSHLKIVMPSSIKNL